MKKKNVLILCLLVSVVGMICFYTSFTIFVIQPIGAVPEGRTLIINRLTNMKFIDSADAMCERTLGGVSLFGRMTVLGTVMSKSKIHGRFPYSEWLYLMSTNGMKYNR